MCLKLKRVRASCIRLTNTAPAHSFYLSPKDAASWPQPPTDTQRSVCSSLLWFRCFAAAQHPVRPCTSAEVPSEKWNRELHHLWETLPPPPPRCTHVTDCTACVAANGSPGLHRRRADLLYSPSLWLSLLCLSPGSISKTHPMTPWCSG